MEKGSPDIPSTVEEILNTAEPFLNDGAHFVVLDHEEFELQENRAKAVFDEVIDYIGLEKISLEVTSQERDSNVGKKIYLPTLNCLVPSAMYVTLCQVKYFKLNQ